MCCGMLGLLGALLRLVCVGAVNMLADNNSTPNVGTTIHTIIEATVSGNVAIGNVHHKCGNLVRSSVVSLNTHSISSVVRLNNAVLCDTEDDHFGARRNVTSTVTAYGGRNVRNVIMVNNSNSFHNTHSLSVHNVPYINVPTAVSGSVTSARCAVNFSATVGAMVSVISHLHSAYSSRTHYDIIRIVNERTKRVTLHANVSINTATVLIPRRSAAISSIVRGVREAHGLNGRRFVVVITRNVNNISTVTGGVRTIANVRAHNAILNRIRHNNEPAIHSHMVTARVNFRTIGLLGANVNGHIITCGFNGVRGCSVCRTLGVAGNFSRCVCGITSAASVWFWGDHTFDNSFSMGRMFS